MEYDICTFIYEYADFKLQWWNPQRSADDPWRKSTLLLFSKDAFKKLKGDNKELMIIPDAVHTDLYDQTDIIPFDKIEEFFHKYLG